MKDNDVNKPLKNRESNPLMKYSKRCIPNQTNTDNVDWKL